MSTKKEFTEAQIQRIYDVVQEFGGDRKPELNVQIKSLMKQDRKLLRSKILLTFDNLITKK